MKHLTIEYHKVVIDRIKTANFSQSRIRLIVPLPSFKSTITGVFQFRALAVECQKSRNPWSSTGPNIACQIFLLKISIECGQQQITVNIIFTYTGTFFIYVNVIQRKLTIPEDVELLCGRYNEMAKTKFKSNNAVTGLQTFTCNLWGEILDSYPFWVSLNRLQLLPNLAPISK